MSRVGKKDSALIIRMLCDGKDPIVIHNYMQHLTLDNIYVVARTAGFPYIKRNGKWWVANEITKNKTNITNICRIRDDKGRFIKTEQ